MIRNYFDFTDKQNAANVEINVTGVGDDDVKNKVIEAWSKGLGQKH